MRTFYIFFMSVCFFIYFCQFKTFVSSVSEVESVEILSMTGPVVINSGNDVTLDCYYNYRYGTSK